MTKMTSLLLNGARSKSRIWFWKPSWHWFGWKTLIPFMYGHDELARRTILLGWTVTGRVIIPVWNCGDPECEADAIAAIFEGESDDARGSTT